MQSKKPDQLKMTIGEFYGPAMLVKNREDADKCFESMLSTLKDAGLSREEATIFIKKNIGYFAGYFDLDTQERVNRLFKTEHPIFGNTTPTPEQAFKMGYELAKKNLKEEKKGKK